MSSSDLSYGSGAAHHLSEVRIVLLGCRKAGKTSSRYTILGRDEFASRTRAEFVKRHGEVAGRKITVVEAPGWQRNKAVRNSTELLKQEIVLSASTCPPGPHALLLVLRLDVKSWTCEKNVLEGYLNLLGDDVWNHTIVLFTFGDFLGDTTIEQYIEREGKAIQWLVEKCGNRYHVFNNKMRDDDSQVIELLEKIEEMVAGKRGCHFEMDKKILQDVEEKRREEEKVEHGIDIKTKKKKKEKERKVEDSAGKESAGKPEPTHPTQGSHKGPHTSPKHKQISIRSVKHPEDIQPFTPELVEKCSEDKNEDENRIPCPHASQFKCKRTYIVFEMGGKEEVLYRIVSWDVFYHQEPARPYQDYTLRQSPDCEIYFVRAHVLLLYEKRTNKLHIHLVPGNVPVEEVQEHENSMYIRATSICHLIPGGKYKADLTTTDTNYIIQPKEAIFDCDYDSNYHPTFEVLFSTEFKDITLRLLDEEGQVVWGHHMFQFTGLEHHLSELRSSLLGNQKSGKSSEGNIIVGGDTYDLKRQGEVAGRKITVVEGPGWDIDRPIEESIDLFKNQIRSHQRPHAVLVVVRLEVKFEDIDERVLEKYLRILGDKVWSHAIILFNFGDSLRDTTIEQHIESQGETLQGLIKRCGNRYHVFDNTNRDDNFQFTELLEKIDEMLVENCAENYRYYYRYLCPHAGRFKCKLTDLVFEMGGKGEVLYRIVSWDKHLLDNLGQKEPAGPMYSIECLEGSIHQLHLPHCETDVTSTAVVDFTVAHVTGGNMELIQPLEVTKTHVRINIQGLSLFSLLKSMRQKARGRNAQILLFYKGRMNKLHIHLLQRNVKAKEVEEHEDSKYIRTTCKCNLIPGLKYKADLTTTDTNYIIQPKEAKFECDDDPNYHPTFEVIFNTEVEDVTLSLWNEKGQEVWGPHVVKFHGSGAASLQMDIKGADFVDKHRAKLIQRFHSVMEVADGLRDKNIITADMYNKIQAKTTPQDKMREVYKCLDSRGRAAKEVFYDILVRNHSYLVNDLTRSG